MPAPMITLTNVGDVFTQKEIPMNQIRHVQLYTTVTLKENEVHD